MSETKNQSLELLNQIEQMRDKLSDSQLEAHTLKRKNDEFVLGLDRVLEENRQLKRNLEMLQGELVRTHRETQESPETHQEAVYRIFKAMDDKSGGASFTLQDGFVLRREISQLQRALYLSGGPR